MLGARQKSRTWRPCVRLPLLVLAWLAVASPRSAEAALSPSVAGGQSGEATGRAVVASAQRYLGVPYVWGGQGQTGFDCSGFIEAVFLAHGYQLPRVSRQQALVGLAVDRPFCAGDLLFFSERPGSSRIVHVALSMGGTRFIHAALGKGEVTYDHLGERYYADRLVGARRPLALPAGRYATPAGLAVANAAVASPAAAAALMRSGAPKPDPAKSTLGAPPTEMVVEHEGPLSPLARADAREEVYNTFADPFGELPFYPEETGFGVRGGLLLAPQGRAGLVALEARYFGHGNGLRLDLAFPLVLHVVRPSDELAADAGRASSVRQWGRLLRLVQLGHPDAQLYLRLSRTDAVSLGEGALMRHFLPNAASAQLSDALLAANDATLVVGLGHDKAALTATLDDVFAPNISGFSLRVAPGGAGGKLSLWGEWASDWRAPYQGVSDGGPMAADGLATRQVHSAAFGPGLRLIDRDGARLRAYALVGTLIGAVRPLTIGFGGHLGLLVSFYSPHRGALGPIFALRLEGRIHSARYRPSYFGFAYAARRRAMPESNSGQATAPPALNVLAAQGGQPAEIGGLVEMTMALGGRLHLGASYEDGGHLGRRRSGSSFVARSLTAFVSLTQLTLGGTRLLRAHALWHTSERTALWPPLGRALPGTFAEASARADLFSWLDVGAAVRKPLGHRLAWPGVAFVADTSAHFAF